jgi:hypothetical protein
VSGNVFPAKMIPAPFIDKNDAQVIFYVLEIVSASRFCLRKLIGTL